MENRKEFTFIFNATVRGPKIIALDRITLAAIFDHDAISIYREYIKAVDLVDAEEKLRAKFSKRRDQFLIGFEEVKFNRRGHIASA